MLLPVANCSGHYEIRDHIASVPRPGKRYGLGIETCERLFYTEHRGTPDRGAERGMGGQWTDKREDFLRYYVTNGMNATEAAKSAGYCWPNKYGPFLVNLGIFREHLAAYYREVKMSPEEILARVSEMARGGITRFYKKAEGGGVQIDWDRVLDSPDSHLVTRIRPTIAGTIIEGTDRARMLDLMGQAYGLWKTTVVNEQADQAVSNAALEDAMERVRAFEAETAPLVKDWRRRVAAASGAQPESGDE